MNDDNKNSGSTPGLTLEKFNTGPACAVHPLNPSSDICERCGNFMCQDCTITDPFGRLMCKSCHTGKSPFSENPIPWENQEKHGVIQAWLLTVKESMTSPDFFFARVAPFGGFGRPIGYSLICSFLGTLAASFYSILFNIGGISLLSDPDVMASGTLFTIGMPIVQIILVPFLSILGLFILSGILHLAALILGASNRDYEASFRAVAYTQGTYLLNIIPFCGGLIAAIWNLVLLIYAFKNLQNTTGSKAAGIVLLPIGVLFGCCCLFSFLIALGTGLSA